MPSVFEACRYAHFEPPNSPCVHSLGLKELLPRPEAHLLLGLVVFRETAQRAVLQVAVGNRVAGRCRLRYHAVFLVADQQAQLVGVAGEDALFRSHRVNGQSVLVLRLLPSGFDDRAENAVGITLLAGRLPAFGAFGPVLHLGFLRFLLCEEGRDGRRVVPEVDLLHGHPDVGLLYAQRPLFRLSVAGDAHLPLLGESGGRKLLDRGRVGRDLRGPSLSVSIRTAARSVPSGTKAVAVRACVSISASLISPSPGNRAAMRCSARMVHV